MMLALTRVALRGGARVRGCECLRSSSTTSRPLPGHRGEVHDADLSHVRRMCDGCSGLSSRHGSRLGRSDRPVSSGSPPGATMPASAPRSATLIDRLTPDVVYGAFLEKALDEGRDAVERGRVSRPDLRPVRADAVVVGADRRAHRARVAWMEDGLFSSCSCGDRRCGHAAALALLLLARRARGCRGRRSRRRRRSATRNGSAGSRGRLGAVRIRRRPGEGRGCSASTRWPPRPPAPTTSRCARSTRRTTAAPARTSRRTSSAPASTSRRCCITCARDAPRRVRARRSPRSARGELPAPRLRARRVGRTPRSAEPVHGRRAAPRRRGSSAPEGRLRGALAEAWPELRARGGRGRGRGPGGGGAPRRARASRPRAGAAAPRGRGRGARARGRSSPGCD